MYNDLQYLIYVCCTDCEFKADEESCTSCKVHNIKDKYSKYTELDYLYEHPETFADKLFQYYPDERVYVLYDGTEVRMTNDGKTFDNCFEQTLSWLKKEHKDETEDEK